MNKDIIRIIKAPSHYFSRFSDLEPSWVVAYIGFYLISFVESVATRAFGASPPSTAIILGRSAVGALGGGVISAVGFGILWLWLGAKLVKGTASLAITVKACGYAFLIPSVLGLLTVPGMLWLSTESNTTILLSIAVIQLIAGSWSLGIAFIALKNINSFSWHKTSFVALWLPVLLFIVLFGARLI